MAYVFKYQLSHKKIFNKLDNLSYIQRTSFRGNDTLYNEKVQFKLTYPDRNGRHKENIEFQVVINLSPIYLDNFRHDGEINILRSQPKACHYGARISDRRRACALSVSE